MGRHSAPDDDPGPDEPAAEAATAGSVAVDLQGRHARGDARPRPALEVPPEDSSGDAADEASIGSPDELPPGEGLALLEEAFEAAPDAQPDPGPAAVAPDDLTTEIPLAELARHDRPLPEETTARIAPVLPDPDQVGEQLPTDEPQTVGPQSASAKVDAPVVRTGSAHATRHDVALVMRHGDVRARALAAILVPFVVYVAVLAVIGELTVHSLIWVWAPAVVAGVLVGLVLDAGHRRYPAPAAEPAATS